MMTIGDSETRIGAADDAGMGTWALRLLLVVLALLAFRILVLWFAGTDLFFDEAQYWSWSEEPAFGYYSKPPLIAWIIGASTSLCGLSEFCIRLPSPLIHSGTALLIFWFASRLYSPQVGFWAGAAFATLPGVSLSSGIISTDVPLLFAWALAMVALVELLDAREVEDRFPAGSAQRKTGRGWAAALLLGFALGLGLNAKYAMAFFAICAVVYLAIAARGRGLLKDPRLYVAIAIAALMITPNVLWNMQSGFATVAHTADNAKWGGDLLHPQKALEFIGAQFGVFGPILFAVFLLTLWRAWKEGLSESDKMMLAWSLPVLVIITTQALLSRAHANWAATAYVAATVLVVATLIRRQDWGWLKGSFALHILVIGLLGVGLWQAGKIDFPGKMDPFARTLGWRGVASATGEMLDQAKRNGSAYAGIITDDRSLSAELLYYLRARKIPLRAWYVSGRRPLDHYELTRPFRNRLDGPLLLVSRRKSADRITKRFATAKLLAKRKIPAGFGKPRRIKFYALNGFKGEP